MTTSYQHNMLREGSKYRFKYVSQAGNYQWYEWEMVAVYVGETRFDEHVLSLRPLAGTQELGHNQVVWIDAMPRTMELMLPKKTGRKVDKSEVIKMGLTK